MSQAGNVLNGAHFILNELKQSYNMHLATVCARYTVAMGSNTAVDFDTGELFD